MMTFGHDNGLCLLPDDQSLAFIVHRSVLVLLLVLCDTEGRVKGGLRGGVQVSTFRSF